MCVVLCCLVLCCVLHVVSCVLCMAVVCVLCMLCVCVCVCVCVHQREQSEKMDSNPTNLQTIVGGGGFDRTLPSNADSLKWAGYGTALEPKMETRGKEKN